VIEGHVDESPVTRPDVGGGDNYGDLVHVWRVKTEVNLSKDRSVVKLVLVLWESAPGVGRIHCDNRGLFVALELGV